MLLFLRKTALACLLTGLATQATVAQVARTYTSSEILHQLKKLRVLGSVLYVAAHPDDENTRLIAWLANHQLYRTGYLSLTRGDGGQNLIGDEQGVELGLIRTQELLAARRIDGGEQFFSRAYDFGFSKSPEETFTKWDHEKVLADAVWVVRKFQPDVVIARFPEDSRAGHGHHSASGIIAREVFEAAADPNRFPEQLKAGVSPWQVKRVLWNGFAAGGAPAEGGNLSIEVGHYAPLLGQNIGELAGVSRSQHKSQGFGVSRQRGSAKENFTLIKGEPATNGLLDGVTTTWSRLPGTQTLDSLNALLISRFNHEEPWQSVALLQQMHTLLQKMEPSVWQAQKLKEVEQLILMCAGIYAEATVPKPAIITDDTTSVNISIINRSPLPATLQGVKAGIKHHTASIPLGKNVTYSTQVRTQFAQSPTDTQPYWLRKAQANGLFTVDDQLLIGKAQNDPLMAEIGITLNGMALTIKQPIQYRYVDPVKAEQYQPVYITDPFLIYNQPEIVLFKKGSTDSATITVHLDANIPANVPMPELELTSTTGNFTLTRKLEAQSFTPGEQKKLTLRLPNYLLKKGEAVDELRIAYKPGQQFAYRAFINARRSIMYDHIPTQTWHFADQLKVLHIDLKTVGKKIGYLPGAGDKVAPLLSQMGYLVTEIKPEDLVADKLKAYDAIVTGVRAYNVHDYLAAAYPELMNYVKQGGNLIVQYNTSNFISQLRGKMAPYAMSISRTRITDENSPVRFALPTHPALNYPNKITQADFEGWIQERSIYHAEGMSESQW